MKCLHFIKPQMGFFFLRILETHAQISLKPDVADFHLFACPYSRFK
jgi:hypothetical protein